MYPITLTSLGALAAIIAPALAHPAVPTPVMTVTMDNGAEVALCDGGLPCRHQATPNAAAIQQLVADVVVAAPEALAIPRSLNERNFVGIVDHWGQCGGEGYSGDRLCKLPYKCLPLSKWYSQCLESSKIKLKPLHYKRADDDQIQQRGETDAEAKGVSEPHETSDIEAEHGVEIRTPGGAQLWQQCDGEGWRGTRGCAPGLICLKISKWYSNCHHWNPRASVPKKMPGQSLNI